MLDITVMQFFFYRQESTVILNELCCNPDKDILFQGLTEPVIDSTAFFILRMEIRPGKIRICNSSDFFHTLEPSEKMVEKESFT
jgi:hypothetical protein